MAFQVSIYFIHICRSKKTKLRGLQSASELYRPSGRRLLAKLVPAFADRGVTWSAQRIPEAVNQDRSRYFSIQVAPQLSSRGWVSPVPDRLLFRKSCSAGNRTQDLWICSQKLWPLDHRDGPWKYIYWHNANLWGYKRNQNRFPEANAVGIQWDRSRPIFYVSWRLKHFHLQWTRGDRSMF
jgi:hypothetical protein